MSEQFRDIQEVISLILHCNVLLPEDFTEYIYHVGNVSEIHSMIRSGLIPEGRSLKRDRQSVFFTAVKPMDDDQRYGRNSMRLGQAKDRTIQKYLDASSKYSVLVQFEARAEERIVILSNKHGPSEWQQMYYTAKEMLHKARQPKHGGHKTILERWHKDDKYRKSL